MSSPPDSINRGGANRAALADAWRAYMEDPVRSWRTAVSCREAADAAGDRDFGVRARTLQAAIAIHQGDLQNAGARLEEALGNVGGSPDLRVAAELAAVQAQYQFLSGDYAQAVASAHRALGLADKSARLDLQIHARRTICMVQGNLEPSLARERVEELLELAIATDEPWEEAISRNDLATAMMHAGELEQAEREAERAMRVLGPQGGGNSFALGLIHATRAEIRLQMGRPAEALADAERARELLNMQTAPNPYVIGETARVQVAALVALGRTSEARATAEQAVAWLENRAPYTQKRIIRALGEA